MEELNNRENQVLALMAQGANNRFIAEALILQHQTIRNHIHEIFRKLHVDENIFVDRRVEAVLMYQDYERGGK